MINYDDAIKLLRYDAISGNLYWKVNYPRTKASRPAGYVNGAGYVCIKVNGKMYLAHRFIWLITSGEWPIGVIDHIDHDTTNNKITNLRDVSVRTNNQNKISSIKTKNRTSQYLGVYFDKRRRQYQAKIGIDKKQKHLGYFNTEIEAYNAYLRGKANLHEGNTL